MQDAITLFYQIIKILVSWVFDAEIVSGVSIGWVYVSIIVFSLLIRNILNVPKAIKNGYCDTPVPNI